MDARPLDPSDAHVEDVCRIGRGHECCRYLLAGAYGFECAKHSEHKATLDARVAARSMVARGDNCEGFPLKRVQMEALERGEGQGEA